jgi:fucose permease
MFQLEVYYNVNYTIISLVFLAPFLGYTLAAFLNNTVHMRFGQLGIAIIGPSCKIIAYVVICIHPPYPVLPVIFMFAGFGIGLADSGWNAWIGNMQNANEMLGILHGCYGLGAAISPLIATAMVTKAHLVWYNFYYLMVCLRQSDFSTESRTSHQILQLTSPGWSCSSRVDPFFCHFPKGNRSHLSCKKPWDAF